jgi:O-antigen/teichoic acid export membrane protein
MPLSTPSKSSPLADVLKASSILFILGWTSSLLGFLIRIILARKLSLEDFGLFYAGLAFVSLVGLLKNMGLNQALVKQIPEYLVKGDYSSVKRSVVTAGASSLITSGLAAGLALLFLGPLARHYFHISLAETVIPILLVHLVVSTLTGVLRGVFQGYRKPFLMTAEQVSVNALVLILLLVFSRLDVVKVCWIYVLSVSVVFVGCLFATFRLINLFLYPGWFSRGIARRMFAFGLPVTATTVTNKTLGSGINTVMLTYFQNVVQVGIFSVAAPFSRIFISMGSAVGRMMFPYSSEMLYRKEPEGLRSMMRFLQKNLLVVMVLGAAFFMLTTPYFVPVLFGRQFSEGVLAAQILILGGVLQAISLINTNVIKGIGHPFKVTRISLVSGLVNFAANLILIPLFSFEGAALATVLGYGVAFFLSNHYLRVSMNYIFEWSLFLKVLGIGLGMFVAGLVSSRAVPIDSLWKVIILMVMMTGIYFSTCLVVKVFTLEELRKMFNALLSNIPAMGRASRQGDRSGGNEQA